MNNCKLTNNQNSFVTNAWQKQMILVFLLAVSVFSTVVCFAQQSNAIVQESDGVRTASAASILTSPVPNGRIGGYRYDGALAPNVGYNSRFTYDNSVVQGDAGNIIGIDRTATSRFGSSAIPFQSKMNYDLLVLRNEYYRAREEANASYLNSQLRSQNEPRLIVATPPKQFPYANDRRARYGKTKEQLLAERNKCKSDSVATLQNETDVARQFDPAQRIWMRGAAPVPGSAVPDAWLRNAQPILDGSGLLDYSQQHGIGAESLSGVGLGGALAPQTDHGGAWSFPRLRTPEEMEQIFIENLETQLLRSPDVNPLSPIQISVQNGVATVRGVVPTPSARVAAGKILLSNPGIVRVNNLMTYVRNDETQGVVQTLPQAGGNTLKSTGAVVQ